MQQQQEAIPSLSVFSRYGLYDRMGDGFTDPPNRREWTFDKLYSDWKLHGFFNGLQNIGFVTVSYNGSEFINFEPTAENTNRHQAIALACFSDCRYEKAVVIAPHEQGLDFSATFEKLDNGDIIYKTEHGSIVHFRFDKTRQSQF